MSAEERAARIRTYVVTGALVGVAAALVLDDVLGLEGPGGLIGLLIGATTLGVSLGYGLSRLGAEDDVPEPVAADEPLREGGTLTNRFFALPTTTSSAVRPVRVKFHTAPMAPPDMELELLIQEFDFTARVQVMDGVLSRLTVREIAERAATEAGSRAPRADRDPNLTMTAFRSEGPLSDDGRCSFGWTFYFTDAELGLACVATTTDREISLQYLTSGTIHLPTTLPDIDPATALEVAYEAMPELAAESLYLRVNLPSEVFLYVRKPLTIADINLEGRTIRNLNSLRMLLDSRDEVPWEGDRFALSDAQDFFRHGDAPPGELGRALADPEFAASLRTMSADAMRRLGAGLLEEHGPQVVADLAVQAESEDTVAAELACDLLGWIPSGLSAAVLQRVAASHPEQRVRSRAEQLFTERRKRTMGVNPDPIDRMNFQDSRSAMGKTNMVAVPLKSTFDIDGEVLDLLEKEAGLTVTRRRVLSGLSPLLITASLRPERGDTEGLITSTPLPVPCHILHLVGSAADTFARRIERCGVSYPIEDIVRDAGSGMPTRAHKAALYLTALRMDCPVGSQPLIDAFHRGRHDRNLRRAIILALAHASGPEAAAFLAERAGSDDADDAAFAAEALTRRSGAGGPRVEQRTDELLPLIVGRTGHA